MRVRDRSLRRLPAAVGYRWAPRVASWVRKRWLLLRHPHVDIRFEGSCYLGPGFSLHAPWGGTFIVGDGVEFRRNFRAELGRPDTRITIGARTSITYNVLFQCDTTIEIGEDCTLGAWTLVVDGNHRFRDLSRPTADQGYDYVPIHIGDGAAAWSKCTIIADLGERAVLGTGTVVTKAVPPYCLAVGMPARVVDYFGPPGTEPPPELAGAADGSASLSDRSG